MFVRIALTIILASVGYLGASAQSLGQRAAAAIREQAVESALAQRGYNVDLSRQRQFYPQSNYQSRRPFYGYGGYNYGRSPFGHGYQVTPFGYGYGYGYQPGVYIHRFNQRTNQPSNLGNRQRTPGSHYFGPPHASQYIPGN